MILEDNIGSDPLFFDTLFHLSEDSPCIDAGAEFVITPWNDTVWAPNEDYEGCVRPLSSGWDIGADEYVTYLPTIKPEKIAVYVFPNPFNSILRIKIEFVRALHATLVQVGIYNIYGRLVYYMEEEWGCSGSPNQSKGLVSGFFSKNSTDNQIPGSPVYSWIPDQSLSSGIYLIRVTIGDQAISSKVLYLK